MSDDNDTNPFGAFLSGLQGGLEASTKLKALQAGGERSILNPAAVGAANEGGNSAASPAAGAAQPAAGSEASAAQGQSKHANLSASAGGVFNGLVARGFTPHQAAAITGNIQAESGFKTGIEGDKGLPGGSSFGLMQWREGRLTALKNLAASQGKDWRDLDVQLDHIKAEALGGDRGFANWFKQSQGSTDVAGLAGSFAAQVERPSKDALAKSLGHRTGAANTAFGMYGKGATTAPPAPAVVDQKAAPAKTLSSILSPDAQARGGARPAAQQDQAFMNPAAAGLRIVSDAEAAAPYAQARGILQAYV